ncbi:MAG: hypothetical protein G01um101466_795 [Parcubacteria group bacterium Gr01-1014_66]|nr:MAG: hypothetical protein G01um101466_795 [Parcubacteria group bacterium Gr01-1014_66]
MKQESPSSESFLSLEELKEKVTDVFGVPSKAIYEVMAERTWYGQPIPESILPDALLAAAREWERQTLMHSNPIDQQGTHGTELAEKILMKYEPGRKPEWKRQQDFMEEDRRKQKEFEDADPSRGRGKTA